MTDVKKKPGFLTWFILLTKAKKLIGLIKALKFLKPLITLGTMIISVVAYSADMGWQLATGFILMIFIHEMGHVVALKRKGHPSSVPIFIPFVGAAIFAPNLEKKPEDEAYVGYGGPLIGGVAALLLFLVAANMAQPSRLLLTVSYLAAFVNLFNMIPIRPLDGGRITQIVGGWFKYIGLAMVLALVVMAKQPGMLLIVILVLSDLPLGGRLKAVAGCLAWAIMLGMMVTGYGETHFLINIVDLVVGAFFCLIFVTQASYTGETAQREAFYQEAAPVIPMALRCKWLAGYVALTVGLMWLMYAHHPYLQAIMATKK